ncbi:MAG TPA: hypothetical protein VLR50_09765 [Desulfobacterales bacterium]|nr:hypothetical protein [Desulfobacterales bacterium]
MGHDDVAGLAQLPAALLAFRVVDHDHEIRKAGRGTGIDDPGLSRTGSSGAALNVIEAAVKVMTEVMTFEEAQVPEKE